MASQPNKHSSLAAFARGLGINPATARTWKRRGLIVADGTGYSVSGSASVSGSVSSGKSVSNETAETFLETVLKRENVSLKRRIETLETEVETLRAEVARLKRSETEAALSQFDDQTPLTPDEIATLDASIDLSPDWGA